MVGKNIKIRLILGLIIIGGLIFLYVNQPKEEVIVETNRSTDITINVIGKTEEGLKLEYIVTCNLDVVEPKIESKLKDNFISALSKTSIDNIDMLNSNFTMMLNMNNVRWNEVMCIPTIESQKIIKSHFNLKKV